jgi:hypothetical protein
MLRQALLSSSFLSEVTFLRVVKEDSKGSYAVEVLSSITFKPGKPYSGER